MNTIETKQNKRAAKLPIFLFLLFSGLGLLVYQNFSDPTYQLKPGDAWAIDRALTAYDGTADAPLPEPAYYSPVQTYTAPVYDYVPPAYREEMRGRNADENLYQ